MIGSCFDSGNWWTKHLKKDFEDQIHYFGIHLLLFYNVTGKIFRRINEKLKPTEETSSKKIKNSLNLNFHAEFWNVQLYST